MQVGLYGAEPNITLADIGFRTSTQPTLLKPKILLAGPRKLAYKA
jgi:hypothetical protein